MYERMLRDGVAPTGTTYTSLISAYGKNGQLDEALRIYGVRGRGAEHETPSASLGLRESCCYLQRVLSPAPSPPGLPACPPPRIW